MQQGIATLADYGADPSMFLAALRRLPGFDDVAAVSGEEARRRIRRSAVQAKLDQLKSQIDIAREHQRKGGETIIQMLLAVISLLQVKSVIAEMFGWEQNHPSVWLALTIGILLLTAAVWWSYRRGLPKRMVTSRSR